MHQMKFRQVLECDGPPALWRCMQAGGEAADGCRTPGRRRAGKSCFLSMAAARGLPGFLWNVCLAATLLMFVEATAAEPAATQSRRVVVLGDSIAAGHGLEPEEAFPVLLQKKVEEAKLPFTVVNAGLSGDTTSGGLRRLDWLLRQRIDVLVVELGGNDGLRGVAPPVTETNLQAIVDRTKSKYPEAVVVIAGMKMPANMGADYRDQFERVFADVAKRNNLPLVPFVLEGVGGRADLNQADRIHPTAEGQRIIAENVWKVLKPLLEQMVSKPQA